MASSRNLPSIGIPRRTECGIAPPPRPPASPAVQQIRKGSVFARIKSLNDLVIPQAEPTAESAPKFASGPRSLQCKHPFVRRGKDGSPPEPRNPETPRYTRNELEIQSPTPQMVVTHPTLKMEEHLAEENSAAEDTESRSGIDRRTTELHAWPAGRTADWTMAQSGYHVVEAAHAAGPPGFNNARNAFAASAAVRTPPLRAAKSMEHASSNRSEPMRTINFSDWHAETPVAASIDQTIEAIIAEHRAMLEAVIKNLRDGAPKLEEARRLSRHLAYMSGDDVLGEPRSLFDELACSNQATKTRSSTGQSSIPELLGMIDAAAGDLGLDLRTQRPDGLHQRANHLARLIRSDLSGGQEDTSDAASLQDQILRYYSTPPAEHRGSQISHHFRHPYNTATSRRTSSSVYSPLLGLSATPPPCRSDVPLTCSQQHLAPPPHLPLNRNTHSYRPNMAYIPSPPPHAPSSKATTPPRPLRPAGPPIYERIPSPPAAGLLDDSVAVSPIYPPLPPPSVVQPFPRFEEREACQDFLQANPPLGSTREESFTEARAMSLRTPVMEKIKRWEGGR